MPAIHTPPPASQYIVYVGSYSDGVHAFRFNLANGNLEALGMKGELKNPSFAIAGPKQNHLFAVSELERTEGAVGSFAIDRHSGSLTKLSTQSSAGTAPCHLATDHSGKMLIVANYSNGSVSAFPIESDGKLGARSALMTATGSSVNRKRQEGPHAHEVVISKDNHYAYVPDLGLDQIRIYKLEPGKAALQQEEPLHVEAGFGPRHLAFSHDEKFLYIFGELKTEVAVYQHKQHQSFDHLQTITSLPADKQVEGGAEIVLDRSGRFLYTSNRDVAGEGTGSVTVFSVDRSTGKLQRLQNVPTAGRMPRGMELDPSGHFLFVGDQKANVIQLFPVNNDGQLGNPAAQYDSPSPVSFTFVSVE